MLFDLTASHPSFPATNFSGQTSDRSPSPILDYPSFLKQQQQQNQFQTNHVASASSASSFPSFSCSTRHARDHNATMDVYQNETAPFSFSSSFDSEERQGRRQHGQHGQQERSHCIAVQQHVAECSICRNFILWQQWNEISHWVVIALVVFYFFRNNTPS